MSNNKTVHIIVRGRVQGVGFRWFAQKIANKNSISGWVKNLFDGTVEIEATGDQNDLNKFVVSLQHDHSWATVKDLKIDTIPHTEYDGFEIKF